MCINNIPSLKMMFLILVLLMNLYGIVSGQNITADPPEIVVTKLIHYQSFDSPFYDPTKTIEDLADIVISSSISRALYLTDNSSLEHPTDDDIDSRLIPGQQYGFLAHLRIGSEGVEQWVLMDTGSNLLWVNCEPTFGGVQPPLFNPQASTTYEPEGCDFSDACDGSGNVKIRCDDYSSDVDGCKFLLAYYGDVIIQGYLARETFEFGRFKTETLRNVVFGCSRQRSAGPSLDFNGVLGLGSLKISLLSQYKSSKFSYCIGDITDRSYAYNELVIGEKVELWGFETSMIVDSKYYINLEGITIGDTPVPLDPAIFRRSGWEGGMVVDSGTSFTFIPQVVLTTFEEIIINKIGYRLYRREGIFYNGTIPRLCYEGYVNQDLKWFPGVKLQFQDEGIMILTPDNIFHQLRNRVFCLSIIPSEYLKSSISVLGNLMQQHFYVAFDLSRKKISFKRMDCKAVEEYYARDEL